MSIEKSFINIKIKRTSNGIQLYAKSPEVYNYFKGLECQEGSELFLMKNNRGDIKLDISRAYISSFSTEAPSSLFLSSGAVNIGFLRSLKLSEGVTFDFTGIYSKDTIQAYVTELKETLKNFYSKYIQKVNIELVITTKEVKSL